jgi:hypothetical protein
LTGQGLFEVTDGGFVATPLGDGPWGEGLLHGGAISALAAMLLEHEGDRAGGSYRPAQLSVQMIRPLSRAAPFQPECRVVRAGRRIRLVECDLVSGGALIVRASMLLLSTLDDVVGDGDPALWPSEAPADSPEDDFPTGPAANRGRATFAVHGIELRPPDPWGTGRAWFRLRVPVVEGWATGGMARAAAAADFSNGISAPSQVGWPPAVQFINADLHVTLARAVEGEWVRMESSQWWSTDATGITEGRLWDQRGPIGSTRQNLVLSKPS